MASIILGNEARKEIELEPLSKCHSELIRVNLFWNTLFHIRTGLPDGRFLTGLVGILVLI